MKSAKANFYKNMIADLRKKNPSQWYSSLKKLNGFDPKADKVVIEEISHLNDKQQVEAIADYFSSIPNEYDVLKKK